MEKLITRREAAELLGISIGTLDEARNNGLISYIQYVPNGCLFYRCLPSGICCQMYAPGQTHGEKDNLSQCAKRKITEQSHI